MDGPAGAGRFLTSIVADQPRADVTKAFPKECPGGSHGFVYKYDRGTIDAAWRTTPAMFYLYVIGVGADGKGDKLNRFLGSKSTLVKPAVAPPSDVPAPSSTPAPVPAIAPVGAVTTFAEDKVSGWACDGNDKNAAIHVRVYLGSAIYKDVVANEATTTKLPAGSCSGTKHGTILDVYFFETFYIYFFCLQTVLFRIHCDFQRFQYSRTIRHDTSGSESSGSEHWPDRQQPHHRAKVNDSERQQCHHRACVAVTQRHKGRRHERR